MYSTEIIISDHQITADICIESRISHFDDKTFSIFFLFARETILQKRMSLVRATLQVQIVL